jgi:ribosomal protein S18 acetylase RimI-like enzyme
MPSNLATAPAPEICILKAERGDLDALIKLEHRVFATDRLSRRSLQRLMRSGSAAVLVAHENAQLSGVAIVLFRRGSLRARLYSIAVAPHAGGRGVARKLLEAAEAQALARGARVMRLEVHHTNHAAIARYRKSGYREFGRHRRYYEDGGDALRFEKRLMPAAALLQSAPPYFHQPTQFTCRPACIMMALPCATAKFRAALDEKFSICGPYGMAVALTHRGLWPEVYVSRPGMYFLETVNSADQRRVMQITQAEFQRQARALDIPSHLAPVNESVLMGAFDSGSVAIVLVSGYHMIPRGVPHWIFAFGRNGCHVLMHDPAAIRDDQGMAAAAETYALPWSAFERVIHVGRERLSAAIVIRKGPS